MTHCIFSTAPSHRTCSDANLPNPRGIYGLVCFPNNYVVTSRDQAWPQEQPGKPPTMPRWCKWWWFVATQIPTSQIGPDWSLVLKNTPWNEHIILGDFPTLGRHIFLGWTVRFREGCFKCICHTQALQFTKHWDYWTSFFVTKRLHWGGVRYPPLNTNHQNALPKIWLFKTKRKIKSSPSKHQFSCGNSVPPSALDTWQCPQ